MKPEQIQSLIEQFAAFGIHRTGWPADDQTGDWLVSWLTRHGVEATLDPFRFPKLQQRAAFVEIAGERIEGVPLHDGGVTGAAGIEGLLVGEREAGATAASSDWPHTLRLLEPGNLADPIELIEARAEHGHAGLIVVTGDPDGQIIVRNAEHLGAPRRLPVLQIAPRDAAPLRQAIRSGAAVRLVIDHSLVESDATNVVAQVRAPASQGLVVLMTPISGWFTCAAERGGGLAIALQLSALAASMPNRRRDLRVLFTSGHEIAHWGLLSHLRAHPELRRQASFWLHLGASIGARYPAAGAPYLFSREPRWRDWILPALARHGAGPATLTDADRRPGGESREVFDHPFLSFAGGHRYFHSPQDTPDIAVDAHSIARYGAVCAEVLEQLLCE